MNLIRLNGFAFDADRIVRIHYGMGPDNQYTMIDLDTPTFELDDEDEPYETTILRLEGVDAIMFNRWLMQNSEDISQIPTTPEPSGRKPKPTAA